MRNSYDSYNNNISNAEATFPKTSRSNLVECSNALEKNFKPELLEFFVLIDYNFIRDTYD
jgi:hypothetical protein